MECLPRPGGNIKMLISTQRRREEKPLLPQMMCFVWFRVSQGTRDADDDSLSRLPTPGLDPKLTITIMCKVSLVAACFHFHFFFCRKIKNIPGNLLRLLLLLLQSSPCGTSEQIYLSQYDGATTMKTALTEGSTLLAASTPVSSSFSTSSLAYDFADSLSQIAGIKFFRFSVLLWSYI